MIYRVHVTDISLVEADLLSKCTSLLAPDSGEAMILEQEEGEDILQYWTTRRQIRLQQFLHQPPIPNRDLADTMLTYFSETWGKREWQSVLCSEG